MKLTGDVRELQAQTSGMQEQARAFREQGGELYVTDPAAE
jgi:hypothetical protein